MNKGAIWSKWDLHIHSPATIFNNNFEGHSMEDKWDRYINEIEKLEDVKVLGITDYYSIDGYLYMIEKKKEGKMIYRIKVKCFNKKGKTDKLSFNS